MASASLDPTSTNFVLEKPERVLTDSESNLQSLLPASDTSSPSGDVRGPRSPWAGSGLDKQVIKNLDAIPLIPEDLHKRIVRCILQAHHLEIVVPPGSNTTTAIQAVLISFVASKLKIASSSPTSAASPMVLVLCIDTIAVERHCTAAKLLGRNVEGLEPGQMGHHDSLSVDLVLAKTCMNRPLWITTLARLGILLQHRVLSMERLSILVLDLRHSHQLNHHTVAELEPLISSLAPHVQLVMLLGLNARVSPALSSLVNGKMEASIRINLSSCSSTPSLSASSLSPTPSQPFSHILTPPSAVSNGPTVIHLKPDYQSKNQVQNILQHSLERHGIQHE